MAYNTPIGDIKTSLISKHHLFWDDKLYMYIRSFPMKNYSKISGFIAIFAVLMFALFTACHNTVEDSGKKNDQKPPIEQPDGWETAPSITAFKGAKPGEIDITLTPSVPAADFYTYWYLLGDKPVSEVVDPDDVNMEGWLNPGSQKIKIGNSYDMLTVVAVAHKIDMKDKPSNRVVVNGPNKSIPAGWNPSSFNLFEVMAGEVPETIDFSFTAAIPSIKGIKVKHKMYFLEGEGYDAARIIATGDYMENILPIPYCEKNTLEGLKAMQIYSLVVVAESSNQELLANANTDVLTAKTWAYDTILNGLWYDHSLFTSSVTNNRSTVSVFYFNYPNFKSMDGAGEVQHGTYTINATGRNPDGSVSGTVTMIMTRRKDGSTASNWNFVSVSGAAFTGTARAWSLSADGETLNMVTYRYANNSATTGNGISSTNTANGVFKPTTFDSEIANWPKDTAHAGSTALAPGTWRLCLEQFD